MHAKSAPTGDLHLSGAEAAAYRRKKNTSQVRLAELMGSTQTLVSRLEQSERLHAGTIARLAMAWGMTPAAFVRAAERAGQ